MGMAAILVMWPGPFEKTFVPLSHGDFNWNFTSIGLAVSKKKKFENVESTNFDIIDNNIFWISIVLPFSHKKA